ncbi:MAG: ATP-binding cassette domain-containing protein [Polyangiaceae bacterium]|nr:ATP-binding cassette domain-containing protein [Polyangiaceae bacterium]
MSSPALAADDLTVTLGGAEILRGVSLAVEAGQVLGVLGPSGAGKSTLFRALSGELRPGRGSVRLGGEDVTGLPLWKRAQRGLGYVPQTPSVLFDLDVDANLKAFGRIARTAKPVGQRAAEVELEGRLAIRARDLSGGERRRLELARALTTEPRVLLCDEPLAGVDPTGAQRIGRILRTRAEAGMAVLVADHRVSEALSFCDRVVLLLDGRVEVTCGPAEFLEHPAVRRRYLG